MVSDNYSLDSDDQTKKKPKADAWTKAVDSDEEVKPKKKQRKQKAKKEQKEPVFLKEGQVKAANKLIGVVDDQDPESDEIRSEYEPQREEEKLDLDQLDFSRPEGGAAKKDIGNFLTKVQKKAHEID